MENLYSAFVRQGSNWFKTTLLVNLLLLTAIVQAQRPTITTVSPESGNVGATVTITGTNFNTVTTQNFVFFSGVRATVSAASTTSLTVTVPVGAAYGPVSVTTASGIGFSPRAFVPTFAGGGTFYSNTVSAPTDLPIDDTGAPLVATADLDGDGQPDVISTQAEVWTDNPYDTSNIAVYRNTGTGSAISFAAPIYLRSKVTGTYVNTRNVKVADMDFDGQPDIIVCASNGVHIFRNTSTPGNISFAPAYATSLTGAENEVHITDIDNDGKRDIVLPTGTLTVLRNLSTPGNLTFTSPITVQIDEWMANIKFADFTGDGLPDMFFYTDRMTFYKNTTVGTNISFTRQVTMETGRQTTIAIADLDMDGKLDIWSVNTNFEASNRLLNTSTVNNISFSLTKQSIGKTTTDLAVGDLNGDGLPDVVGSMNTGGVWVSLNTSTIGNLSFTPFTSYTGTGLLRSVAIDDLNRDGKPDIVAGTDNLGKVSIFTNLVGIPYIASFTPQSGATGNQVTITGDYFTGTTAVSFGGVAATSFTVVNATTIQATVASGADGAVSVTNAYGTFTKTGFTYILSPTISSFAPTVAKAGQSVVLTGTRLNNVTAVRFGGVAARSFVINSATQITAVVDNGASGDISVVNNAGTGTLPGFFFITPPVITSVTPAQGAPGSSITIGGTGFSPTAGLKVFFGPVQGTVTASSATSITATVPSNAVYRNLTVNVNGMTGQSPLPFKVIFGTGDSITNNSFVRTSDLPVGNATGPVVTADFDGDGKTDMIAGTSSEGFYNLRNTTTGADITFQSVNFPFSGSIKFMVAGDLNGDGKPDIAAIKHGSSANPLIIFKNTSTPGTISFEIDRSILYPGYSPAALALTDIDGDGRTDIIGINETNSCFTVVRTIGDNGNLVYAAAQHITLASNPTGLRVVTGLFNNDQKADVVLLTSRGISSFINNSTPGTVQFGAEQFVTAGFTNRAMTAGDVNNDGFLDLVFTYVTSSTLYKVGVMTSSQSGSNFTLSPIYELAATRDPVDVALEDFDGDGNADILIPNRNLNTVSLYHNTLSGSTVSFSAAQPFAVGTNPLNVATADFNNDSKPDIFAINRGTFTATLLTNRANSALLTTISPKTGGPGTEVTLTGFNLSGVTSVTFGNTPAASFTIVNPTTIKAISGEGSNGLVRVFTATTSASIDGFTFEKPAITSFTPSFGKAGSTVTINGANFSTILDSNTVYFGAVKATITAVTNTTITVTVPAGATWSPLSVTSYGATAFSSQPFILAFGGTANLDSASFATRKHYLTNASSAGVAIGDLNGDGKSDLVTVNEDKRTLSVFINNGTTLNASYALPVSFTAGNNPYDIAITDMNADKKPDIVIGIDDSVCVFLNTGSNGISYTKYNFVGVPQGNRLAVADLDADKRVDIAVISSFASTLKVLRNTSTATTLAFTNVTGPVAVAADPQDIVAADLNGDGKPELVVTDYYSSQASVYRNTSTTTIAFAAAQQLDLNGYSFAAAAGDLDADGKPDLVISKLKQNALPAISVFKNNSTTGGALFFTHTSEYALGQEAAGVAITDMNGDSKPDVIVANGTNNGIVSIFRNDATPGTIALQSAANYSTGTDPVRVVAGDLNGDGKPDLVTANRLTNLFTSRGGLYILYNLLAETPATPEEPAEEASRLTVTAGPNPFTTSITVKVQTAVEKVKLQLVDRNGVIVQTWEYATLPAGASVNVTRPGLQPGIYYLVLVGKQGRTILRVIKQ